MADDAKLKVGLIGLVAAAVVVVVPLVVQHQSLARLRDENQALREQIALMAGWEAENSRLSNLVAQATSNQALSSEQLRDLMRLRNEVAGLRAQTNEVQKLREENRRLRAAAAASPNTRQSASAPGSPAPDRIYPMPVLTPPPFGPPPDSPAAGKDQTVQELDFNGVSVRDVLDVYKALTDAELDVQVPQRAQAARITLKPVGPMSRSEAIRLMEQAMRNQAGVVATRLDTKHILVSYDESAKARN